MVIIFNTFIQIIKITKSFTNFILQTYKFKFILNIFYSESKIQNYLGSKVNHYKIVTDKWIIDSIKAKKRLSEAPYLTLNTLKVIIKKNFFFFFMSYIYF